jgi:hypothetical protein
MYRGIKCIMRNDLEESCSMLQFKKRKGKQQNEGRYIGKYKEEVRKREKKEERINNCKRRESTEELITNFKFPVTTSSVYDN